MTFLITGANGQLGKSFVNFFNLHDVNYYALDRRDLDITNGKMVQEQLKKIDFDILINTAAYTQVDQAEHESSLADAVNNIGVMILAENCKKLNKLLVHFSTDYVFDGSSSIPYKPNDDKYPINEYGKSKLRGELAIANSGCRYLIFRTAWIFSEHSENFLKTILSLASDRDKLDIVSDQIGSPTYATHIVETVFQILIKNSSTKKSIYHIGGYPEVSWYEFAKEIIEYANQAGVISSQPKLNPVNADHFNSVAARPNYSILDSTDYQEEFGLEKKFWKEGVHAVIHSIIDN